MNPKPAGAQDAAAIVKSFRRVLIGMTLVAWAFALGSGLVYLLTDRDFAHPFMTYLLLHMAIGMTLANIGYSLTIGVWRKRLTTVR